MSELLAAVMMNDSSNNINAEIMPNLSKWHRAVVIFHYEIFIDTTFMQRQIEIVVYKICITFFAVN